MVGRDSGADGFAVVVGAEGVVEFGLGVVDGLEESLGHVGDGAGGAGLDVAADDGGAAGTFPRFDFSTPFHSRIKSVSPRNPFKSFHFRGPSSNGNSVIQKSIDIR